MNPLDWKTINDKDAGSKQAIYFHNGKGGLIKIGSGYKNVNHHFKHELTCIVIEGKLELSVNPSFRSKQDNYDNLFATNKI